MNELIKIQEKNGQKLVDARELYSFLGGKQQFANWIRNRIKKYGFIENKDFTTLNNFIKGGISIEYALTLDMAKELAMVENNEKGRMARQYFIECENRLRQLAQPKPLSTLDMLELSIRQLREQESRVSAVEHKVAQLEARTATRPEYFTIVGYAILNKMQVSLKIAASIGRKAAAICRQNGYPMETVPDPRFGLVRSYPKTVLQQVFNDGIA